MNGLWLLGITGAGALMFMVAALLLIRQMRYQARLALRVQLSRGLAPSAAAERGGKHGSCSRVLGVLGQAVLRTGLLSSRTRTELEMTLMSAGLRGRNGLEIFIGGKVGLMVGLPLLALLALREIYLSPLMSMAIPAAAAVVGMLLPDIIVRYRRKRYIQRVERGLPDALDLLVICSQAGLGLTAAIIRVAEEMQTGDPAIGTELAITANELQIMADSRVALLNMGTRTGVDGLTRLGTTLVQSMQYGTPLTASMRVLSAEMRQDTLTRFESRAARLGVLLTLPMVVFILPCVFLIVGGPAVVQVMRVGN